MPSSFPAYRPRRLRKSAWIRDLLRENQVTASDFIYPLFVQDGENTTSTIDAMPNVQRFSIDLLLDQVKRAADAGIKCVALFPQTDPSLKTLDCAEAYNENNLVNRATRAIKDAGIEIGVMLDVALDPYNASGQDGITRNGEILNDETLDVLEKQALSHAKAGADILGPSDMMDGRIGRIRAALEINGFCNLALLSYSAKFASAYYGPFRDAVGASGALKGDKKTYQLDPANAQEAMRMIARDIEEGADMVMVKPGQTYLDICRMAADRFDRPVFAYHTSGEYAMIEAAAQNGWIDRESAISEALLAFKRAGCSGVLSYHALEVAEAI